MAIIDFSRVSYCSLERIVLQTSILVDLYFESGSYLKIKINTGTLGVC